MENMYTKGRCRSKGFDPDAGKRKGLAKG